MEKDKIVPVIGRHSKSAHPTNEAPPAQLPVGHLIAEEVSDLMTQEWGCKFDCDTCNAVWDTQSQLHFHTRICF